MLSHVPLVPGRVVRRGGDRGIEPLDHRGIAEAVRIVAQLVACEADDVESLLDLEAERRVRRFTRHDALRVSLRQHFSRDPVIAVQASARLTRSRPGRSTRARRSAYKCLPIPCP